jgi:RNA polymerase primary sigma factor
MPLFSYPDNEPESITQELQHEVLPETRVRELISIAQSNRGTEKGMDAEAEIIRNNVRLIVSVAKRFRYSSDQEYEDLICLGKIGLLKAIRRFNLDSGFAFSTYAVIWIRSDITRNGTHKGQKMYYSSALYDERAKIHQAQIKIYQATGVNPDRETLIETSGVSTKNYDVLENSFHGILSLENAGEDNDHMALEDQLFDRDSFPDEDVIEKVNDERIAQAVQKALLKLNEKQQWVARRRFMEGATLSDIAPEINVSRERVRQIAVIARRKLRKELEVQLANLS